MRAPGGRPGSPPRQPVPLYACRECGTTSTQPRCPAHRQPDRGHTGRSPSRDRSAQRRLRRQLIARHGTHCARCGISTPDVRAAHRIPVRDGGSYSTANADLLCPPCDRATDLYAR